MPQYLGRISMVFTSELYWDAYQDGLDTQQIYEGGETG